METLFKAYVYRNLLSDLTKTLGKTLNKVDADSLLRRVGLARHRPVRRTVGEISLLLLGVSVGAMVGLALAPKRGAELRADAKEKAKEVLDSVSKLGGMGAPTKRPRESARV